MAKIDFEAIFIGRLNLPCGIRTGSFHLWIRPTLALLKNLNLPSQVTLQTFCLNPKAFPVLKVRGLKLLGPPSPIFIFVYLFYEKNSRHDSNALFAQAFLLRFASLSCAFSPSLLHD